MQNDVDIQTARMQNTEIANRTQVKKLKYPNIRYDQEKSKERKKTAK